MDREGVEKVLNEKIRPALRMDGGNIELVKVDENKVFVKLMGACGGCPGGNIEYAPEEMKKNGAEVIHLATGMLVGYPPCPRVDYFRKFIPERFGLKVVVGTHPIPEKYNLIHGKLKTWNSKLWKELIKPTMPNKKIRLKYD